MIYFPAVINYKYIYIHNIHLGLAIINLHNLVGFFFLLQQIYKLGYSF